VPVRRSETVARCELSWSDGRLAVAGEIDAANAGAIADRMHAAITTDVRVIDLSEVTFFSAAGVRMLLAAGASARMLDSVVLVPCPPPVWMILDLCDLPAISGLSLERVQGLPRWASASDARSAAGSTTPR
jgi:anti-anti-sigma factor